MTFRLTGLVALTLVVWQSQQSTPPPAPSPFVIAAERAKAMAYPGAGREVALTFDWADNLAATIEVQQSKTMVTPQGRRATSATMRYRMRVLPHKEGRLIQYDNFELVGMPLTGADQLEFVEVLSSMMPSIIVAPNGEFVRVADLTMVRATMKKLIDGIKAQAPGGSIPPGLQEVLDGITSDAGLTRLAAQEWELIVGWLVGFTGTIGEMRTVQTEEPSPVLPTLQVPMRTTFGALRSAPCEFDQAEDSCVDMQIRSVVAPGGMEVVMKRLLEGARNLDGLTYERFDVATSVINTIEPATMRPHRVVQTKTSDFTMAMPGRGRADASITERRAYRIQWR